jgi:hypothetical protein
MRRPLFVVLLLGAVLVVPGTASASMRVASNARHATLKVVAGGAAEVDWVRAGGGRGSVVIYPNGSRRFGAHLKGRDVSFATTDVSLPMARVTKQTPNGRYWALQAWRRLRTGPVELRFSRWRGAPTLLTLDAVCCKWRSENIIGRATFHGRPIYGYRATRTGNPLDKYGRNVYLDTYRHNRWQRMMGILTHHPTGKFSLWIRPYWRGTAYRGRIIGPNWGRTLAPDAQASAPTSR